MKKELIVAAYKEPLEWLKKVEAGVTITVYTKSSQNGYIELTNEGREAHTYLYHIITNYERLADVNIFCQGNPFDHCPDFLEKMSSEEEIEFFGKLKAHTDEKGGPYHIGLPVGEYVHRLGLKVEYPHHFLAGAQFVITKERLLKHPKEYYEKLLAMSLEQHGPWVLERLWNVIL